jgi:monoamine oxidase
VADRDADVVVVGAGYAGLTAARDLIAEGASVVVMEARDRVGGRVWTRATEDGTPIDVGGAWIGPGQDAVYALAKEVGVGTYPTWSKGETVLVSPGGTKRYSGNYPNINPIALASLGLAISRLDKMAKQVPLEDPWNAPNAALWDGQSAGTWIDSKVNIASKDARDLVASVLRGLWTSEPSEVSLLHTLYLIRSAGGLNKLVGVEGGYQQDRISGGAQLIAERLADALGDALLLETPAREIEQDQHGVTVWGDGLEIRAERVVVAIPPALAGRIHYEPMLPNARTLLTQRTPAGSIIKIAAVYDEPFWRADGLSGQTVAPDSLVELTLDASPETGAPGVIAAFAFGPRANTLSTYVDAQRRQFVLAALVERFGRKASAPRYYEEHDWSRERWTEGCYLAHLPPGVMTQFGAALRAPVGRVHWAGTETATTSHGTIDGAIRSGKRVAAEIVAAE